MYKKGLILAAAVLMMLFVATSCSNKNAGAEPSDTSPAVSTDSPQPSSEPSETPTEEPSAAPSVSQEEQIKILEVFDALLNTPGNEKAALTEIDKDISKLSPENADEMILSLEAYQRDAISNAAILSDELIGLISKSVEPYDEKTLNDPSKITDETLKAALQAVLDKGYKIIVPEGMYEPVINYDVYKTAGNAASPDIAAYIGIMAKESESRMSEDAAIIIPIDEVFARAQAVESFVTMYPSSVKYDEMHQRYAIYVDAWFFGQNNTPAFDYFTKKLDQEFLDSYEKVAGSGGTDALTKATVDYLKILKENDYTLTDTVTNYRKNMTNSLKNSAS